MSFSRESYSHPGAGPLLEPCPNPPNGGRPSTRPILQPSECEQAACLNASICNGGCRNSASYGSNQRNRQRGFAFTHRAGGSKGGWFDAPPTPPESDSFERRIPREIVGQTARSIRPSKVLQRPPENSFRRVLQRVDLRHFRISKFGCFSCW